MTNVFWERFYDLCESRGTKPNPVAKEIGVSSGVVTKWKEERTIPNGETLIKISNYFDCSIDYLLGRTDEPNLLKKERDINIMNANILDNERMLCFHTLITLDGKSIIINNLKSAINNYGIDPIANKLSVDFTDIRKFLNVSILHKPVLSKLDIMFEEMNINLFLLFSDSMKENYSNYIEEIRDIYKMWAPLKKEIDLIIGEKLLCVVNASDKKENDVQTNIFTAPQEAPEQTEIAAAWRAELTHNDQLPDNENKLR